MCPAVDIPQQLALGTRFRALQLPTSPNTIPYDPGNTRGAEVPKTYLTKDLALRLTGNLVVTVATATILAEAPLGLITKVELLADGSESLFAMSGRDAYRLGAIFHGKAGELVPPVGTAGTNAFSAFLILSSEAVNMAVPVDSYLDLREFEKTEIRIQWGAATTIATAGGGGTIEVDATTTQAEVYANQTTEGLPSIGFRRFISYDDRPILSTQSDYSFLVPRSGLLAGVLFHTYRDEVPVDDIVNYITLTSDGAHDHVKRRSWRSLQSENVMRYQLDGGPAANGGKITGYAYLDFLEDGRLASAINTEALNELKITLDVTLGAGTLRQLRATYLFFKPLRRAVA